MEIHNEILSDYSDYCHRKLVTRFGGYDTTKYDPIYWYQRYKHRIIQPQAREVVEASGLIIPTAYVSAYEEIKQDISNGHELAKYQSRKLEELDYDDDMLSHWAIQHLHLGSEVESDGYVKRTGDLLFVFFKNTKAYVVGVFDHSSWCDIDIIEVLHANWPEELSIYKQNTGVTKLTREQYKVLRNKNACASVVVNDGTEYLAPGIGVTANGAPISAVFNSDKVIHMFNVEYEAIKENIRKILDSDPESRTSEKITIGMEICPESKRFIYQIKETGFKFSLQS